MLAQVQDLHRRAGVVGEREVHPGVRVGGAHGAAEVPRLLLAGAVAAAPLLARPRRPRHVPVHQARRGLGERSRGQGTYLHSPIDFILLCTTDSEHDRTLLSCLVWPWLAGAGDGREREQVHPGGADDGPRLRLHVPPPDRVRQAAAVQARGAARRRGGHRRVHDPGEAGAGEAVHGGHACGQCEWRWPLQAEAGLQSRGTAGAAESESGCGEASGGVGDLTLTRVETRGIWTKEYTANLYQNHLFFYAFVSLAMVVKSKGLNLTVDTLFASLAPVSHVLPSSLCASAPFVLVQVNSVSAYRYGYPRHYNNFKSAWKEQLIDRTFEVDQVDKSLEKRS
jgi:hypothetical protein